MPRIVINNDLIFYTVTAPVGSPRLPDPPPNHADDVLLVQWMFHKFIASKIFLTGAILDAISMDGIYGRQTDYMLHYFLVTNVGNFLREGEKDDLSLQLAAKDLQAGITHRLKPIKELSFGAEFGDRRPMSIMNMSLVHLNRTTITAKNPIQSDMPVRLQTALKANIFTTKGAGGGSAIRAPSA